MTNTAFDVSPADAARIARDLGQGRTLPLSWYTDPEVLTAEIDRIYSSTWQYIGRAADVADTGQFVTAEIAGRPIVVVRDRDGSLNAFHLQPYGRKNTGQFVYWQGFRQILAQPLVRNNHFET